MFAKNNNNFGWISKDFQPRVKLESVNEDEPPGSQGNTGKSSLNTKGRPAIQDELSARNPNGGGLKKPSLLLPKSLEAIAAAMPVPLLIARAVDGIILYANCHYCAKFNEVHGNVVGRQMSEIYQNPHREIGWQKVLEENDRVTDYEVTVKKADGTQVWMSMSAEFLSFEGSRFLLTTFSPSRIHNESDETLQPLAGNELAIACDGNLVGELGDRSVRTTGTISDITERKNTELALIHSEANLRAIFNASVQGIILIDLDYKIKACNKRANHIAKLIWQKELHEREPIYNYICDEGFEDFNKDIKTVLSGININKKKHIKKNFQEEYWVKLHYSPVFDERGNAIAVCLSVLNITEQKKTVDALRYSEERFKSLVQNSSDIITIVESNGMIRYQSPSCQRILGYDPEALLGENAFDYVHPEDRASIEQAFGQEMRSPLSTIEVNFRFRHGNGQWIYLESIATNRQDDPKINGFVVNSRDITDRQEQQERLQLLERAISASKNAMTISDVRNQNKLVYVNPAFEEITGYTASEAIGSNYRFFLGGDREQPELDRLRDAITTGTDCTVVLRNYRKDGSCFWNELQVAPVYNGQNQLTHFIGIQTDISDRKAFEEQLTQHAYYDQLTGLANRSSLMEHLQAADGKAQEQPNYKFALLLLDLDRFKVVNDSLGHAVGDILLIVIALRLKSCLEAHDILARTDGDHFTILLEDIDDTRAAIEVAEKIQEHLQEPFTFKGHEFFISGSIGIALSSMGYEKPADLLRNADIAMYRAKENGKAQHAVFDKAMHERVVAELQLENELRHTIEEMEAGQSNALWLAYQPIICLKTGKIQGFETLVRWNHPEKGFIPPAKFIPIAEESGLIIPLGSWILREACHQLREWQLAIEKVGSHVCDRLTMSVNLSGKQFLQLDLIQLVDEIIEETGLSPKSLKLEITETAIVENIEYALETINQLRDRQIILSLDDFGTGYSSLSYLHEFPLDNLKIDRSFVNSINPENKHHKIIQAIVTLAHALGMDVTAEGLETPEQIKALTMLGCELGQGYIFSEPLDREAASNLLLNSTEWLARDI